MSLERRSYHGESDWPMIAGLISDDPAFHQRYDFPWRLCSTSLENHKNAAIWEDENKQPRIFASLQFPWLTLDYAIHPGIRTWEAEAIVIEWGESRLHQIAEETNSHFPFNISAYAHEVDRITFLEGLGYTRWENHLVLLSRSLVALTEPHLPEGFTIRSLAGEPELASYAELHRAAFNSTTMTADWRQRTLHAPLYNPALDLVVVAPDDRLAGFCIWWYSPESKLAQIEPLGVHPDFQHLGLSQALMAEGFKRVAAHGAETALVESYSFNQAALRTYGSAGFRESAQKLKYYKNY